MGRAPCCDKNGLNRGPWTPEEDQKLMDYIRKHGPGSWRTLPKNAGLSRCGKSCRLRWANYLRPDIRRGRFSFEEEQTMIQLHSILGNKWSAIAARLPGRTDNEIKNHWNTHIRKRLLRMGIDPATHRPRLDLSSLLNPSSHLGLSSFLGVQPTVGTELLQVAAINLLSAQCQKAELLQQNSLHEQPQQQQQQQQQLSNTLIQYLSQPFFSPDQQLQSSTAQPNLWQNNSMPCASLEDFSAPPVDPGFYGYAPSMCAADPVAEASAFASKGARQSFDFSPAMPTPVSSLTPTHMDSPATDVNSTTITGEDERDSYCSSVLDFQIMPDLLDIGGFM